MIRPVDIGQLPPLGKVPDKMYAQVIRSERMGDPATAFKVEEIDTPHPGVGEVLVAVMAAGINFNNVWALCARGGMVVICAGTTGYSATVDLRYHWVNQKRLQGSHGSNDEQARRYNDLVTDGTIDPALGQVVAFEEIPHAHAEMHRGHEVFGNRVALVGTSQRGAGRRD